MPLQPVSAPESSFGGGARTAPFVSRAVVQKAVDRDCHQGLLALSFHLSASFLDMTSWRCNSTIVCHNWPWDASSPSGHCKFESKSSRCDARSLSSACKRACSSLAADASASCTSKARVLTWAWRNSSPKRSTSPTLPHFFCCSPHTSPSDLSDVAPPEPPTLSDGDTPPASRTWLASSSLTRSVNAALSRMASASSSDNKLLALVLPMPNAKDDICSSSCWIVSTSFSFSCWCTSLHSCKTLW
mmetsp:Transcript_69889/g.214371  ORF Transcript_69889/g.214371 Transcript_69889/m.214371 type:complete len:244 (-) Transcript_69889:647-1378(-)